MIWLVKARQYSSFFCIGRHVNDSFYLCETYGDIPINFENQYVQIDEKRYLISSGLLELLFKQKPDEA